MIPALVKSAFETGYLSVESEGLIRQLLATHLYRSSDLRVLEQLFEAVQTGQIRREAKQQLELPSIRC